MDSLLLIKLTLSFIDATIEDVQFNSEKAVNDAMNNYNTAVKEYNQISEAKYSDNPTLCNKVHQDLIVWTSPISSAKCYINLVNKTK
jgi:hypothetical protein